MITLERIATHGFLVLTVGLAPLLIYSRLIGMALILNGLLEDAYAHRLKNAVEELSELLA